MPPRLCYNLLWSSGLLLRVLRAADGLGRDAADDPSLGCPVEYIDLRGTSVDSPAVCKYTGKCYSGFHIVPDLCCKNLMVQRSRREQVLQR